MKTKTIYLDEQKQFRFDLVLDNATKTKLKKEVYTTLLRFPYEDLRDCYNSYSYYKERAYNDCLQKAIKLNAELWGIISHNSMQFTFAYVFNYNDKNYLAFITKCYDYLVELD